jgi:hypothetical protein
MFAPQPPETNLPKLQLFRGATPELVGAIQACMSDPKKPEDVLEFEGDDPYDGSRYLIKRVHRYFQESQQENESRKKLANIIEGAHTTQDLYMAMRRYEEETKVSDRAVTRRLLTPSQRYALGRMH